MAFVSNKPDYRVTTNGVDITPKLREPVGTGRDQRSRLISLTLTEKRGDEADQLDLVIDDSDGRFAIPKPGAIVTLQLGWLQGSEVTAGLVDKGSFIVDTVEHSGPPDTISLHARSADLTGQLTTRREQSWRDTTLGAVVTEVAKRQGLTPRCADSLAGVEVQVLVQSRESDMGLLRRLGREHDAVATIKKGALIFSPIGAATTASGKTIPPATIRRRDGDRHSYTIERREEVTGIEAEYHDVGAATKKRVKVGEDGHRKRLSRVYANEAAATAAAKAEQSRAGRIGVKLNFNLALGRPDLYPDRPVTASGFKSEIDAQKWLIAEVAHDLSDRGLVTALQMEAGDLAARNP